MCNLVRHLSQLATLALMVELFKYIYTLSLCWSHWKQWLLCCSCAVTVFYIWVYDCITLTHPLGVALAGSSQQIAAAGWGPKIHIPVCSMVLCDVDGGLWHNGLLGLSLCRETSVWCCCSPAIQPWGYDAVGPVLQSQGGYETGLARWRSLGCVAAPGKGQRRNSSAGELSDRYRALDRPVGEKSNDSRRRRGAAQQPRMAPVSLPLQPALRVQIMNYS